MNAFFSICISLQLLSLKAELLRKQEEVNRVKKQNISDPFAINKSNTSNLVKKKSIVANEPDKSDEKPKSQKYEDIEMLAKSKRILEAKARLYDRMSSAGGSLNSDDSCLVRFNQKKQTERSTECFESNSNSDSDEKYESDDDTDGKWTEFTDSFGRTRKCLKEGKVNQQ